MIGQIPQQTGYPIDIEINRYFPHGIHEAREKARWAFFMELIKDREIFGYTPLNPHGSLGFSWHQTFRSILGGLVRLVYMNYEW